MIKKISFPKILFIFCFVGSGSMLKGMEFLLETTVSTLWAVGNSDFVKDNAHHLIRIGVGVGAYTFYRLTLSRFDDLEELMEEVKEEVKRNGDKIGENGKKIDQLLKDIEKLPNEEKMKRLLELQTSKILQGNMKNFNQFKEGVESKLEKLKDSVTTIQDTLKKVQENQQEFGETLNGLEKTIDENNIMIKQMVLPSYEKPLPQHFDQTMLNELIGSRSHKMIKGNIGEDDNFF